jgi:signal transduction histidine kinase/CheY-like chemotaxis protein
MSEVSMISTAGLLDGGIGDDYGDAANESDDGLRRLVHSYPGPVIAARVWTGEVVHESTAAKSLFRVDPESESDRAMPHCFADPADYSTIMERLKVESEVSEVELELSRMDSTTFWASVSASIIGYRNQALCIFNFVDISKYKSAEQRIARQSESLHQSEKLAALGSLLAGVAHELNNPLSVVSAQALLMQDTSSDPRLIERAAKIANAADRCSRIVRTFLSMARQRPLERGAVNLNEVVDSVVSVTNYSLRKSNIELTLDLKPHLPRIWANDDELNQVVTNLVVNAQQAVAGYRDSGNLRIVSAYDDVERRVLLSINDDGPGVPHDIRSRIFEPFFTTKEVGEGTGIGLAVCHRIVESLHGKIRLVSHPGHGCSFTISLPAIPEDRATVLGRSEETAKPEACRVLVVDNEPEITSMLKEILALDGHDVRCAPSGEKALQLLARHDFQIILTDLRMPSIDGIGLYQTLARLTPGLLDRVGFITGDTFSSSTREFLRQTECPHIEKPFTPEQVRMLVEELQARARFGALLK